MFLSIYTAMLMESVLRAELYQYIGKIDTALRPNLMEANICIQPINTDQDCEAKGILRDW